MIPIFRANHVDVQAMLRNAERTATPAQKMVCCKYDESVDGQKGDGGSAEGTLRSVISETDFFSRLKRSSLAIHAALGAQLRADDDSSRRLDFEDYMLQSAGIFVGGNRIKGENQISTAAYTSPAAVYVYWWYAGRGKQPKEEKDWVLAERYWDCIRPNTWRSDSDAGGDTKLAKEIKEKWLAESNHKLKLLRHRPSDVVNALIRLDGEEKSLLMKVKENGNIDDDQQNKLGEIQVAKEKYGKAFPVATKRLLPLLMRVHNLVSLGLGVVQSDVLEIPIRRLMNTMDINHLRDTILPAIEYTCAARKANAKQGEDAAPSEKQTSFLQVPEEVPSTPSAVAWPAPAGNVTSFLQSTSWTKHQSSEHQNLAEDVTLALDERDEEGSEDANEATEVN